MEETIRTGENAPLADRIFIAWRVGYPGIAAATEKNKQKEV